MHTYDSPRRRPFQPIPSARPAQDPPGGPSATPIYDALYAEWVRSFRTLPGDRHGEEEAVFTPFGSLPRGASSYTSYSTYSSYSAGAHSALQDGGQHTDPHRSAHETHTASAPAVWQAGVRQHGTGMHHVPAALPPAPRKGI
ncbi:hypothetical protein ACFYP4_28435 [Streptomyces sp. NPDC005551]|uniref:hypothetical protein n=1 Tax=unclassified Streptomyces TaxID=2593676 RepID=UPI0033E99BA3